MKHDNERIWNKRDFCIPFQSAKLDVFDWNMINDLPGSYWNSFCALNPPVTMISELLFLTKIPSLQWPLLRSFVSPSIRFMIMLMY